MNIYQAKYWKVLLLLCSLFLAIGSCSKSNDHPDEEEDQEENSSGSDVAGDTTIIVNFDDEHVQYEGRVDLKNDGVFLFWPGTAIRLRFKGEQLSVVLEDDKINTDQYANYFNVIIDGEVSERIKLEKEKNTYVLAKGLSNEEHVVELFKLNSMHPSYPRGHVKLYRFEIKNGEILAPPKPKSRKMEFYGNSITCGYGNEHVTGSDNSSKYENNYLAYGAVTARHFDAQYYCIARSGLALTKINSGFSMLELYEFLNPFYNNVKWDFSKYTPDIVVVNILQNDASRAPDEPANVVKNNYKDFILNLRDKYPNAHIICTLGPMNAVTMPKWTQVVSDAVSELGDDKVYKLFFEYLGRTGHPKVADDQLMAEKLISFIENNENIDW